MQDIWHRFLLMESTDFHATVIDFYVKEGVQKERENFEI